MTSVILLGIGAGIGLLLVLIGLFPPVPRLDKALAQLQARPHQVEAPDAPAHGWTSRVGRPGQRVLSRLGLSTAATRRALATTGKSADVHLAEQATATIIGLLLPSAISLILSMAGIQLGVVFPLWTGLGLAVLGFVVPDLAVRSEAARLRAEFRQALSAFLDLVVVSLSGGAGIDQALHDAAIAGHGPAFDDIRHALRRAELAHTAPWDTLAELGERLEVTELEQLAATVGLAGDEGAKIRASLTARAQTLRTRQLADAEATASAATERMSLPVVALFAAFLIFLSYPALEAVLSGL